MPLSGPYRVFPFRSRKDQAARVLRGFDERADPAEFGPCNKCPQELQHARPSGCPEDGGSRYTRSAEHEEDGRGVEANS